MRLALVLLLVIASATIWITNRLMTDRFTESTRNRAELRLALYSGNLTSELRGNRIVPQLLARDPTLIGALNSNDFSQTTQRLFSFAEDLDAASLMLLDLDGRTVAATDRALIGAQRGNELYFVDAVRSNSTVFSVNQIESGGFKFFYSRRIESGANVLGVIVIEVDLQRFETAWRRFSPDAVMVADSTGTIILSSEPNWRGLPEDEALKRESPRSAIERGNPTDFGLGGCSCRGLSEWRGCDAAGAADAGQRVAHDFFHNLRFDPRKSEWGPCPRDYGFCNFAGAGLLCLKS